MSEPDTTPFDSAPLHAPEPSRTTPNSPDLYRALLDSMTEGVSLCDEAGTIVYTNPAEDALFGYEPGELLGQHVSILRACRDEESLTRVDEVIAQLKAHGSWEGRWLDRRKDGSTFTSEGRISAVPVDGRPHWLCVQRDVSAEEKAEVERCAADENLRDSEELQRTITNAVPAIVWLARPNGELHYFNDRWYDYSGQAPGQALPSGWADALHPDDAPVTARQWADALAAGQGYENECRYRRRDGEYRWHVARATPLRDARGAIKMWFGTSTDIHARKKAELALAESEARFRGVFNSRLTGLTIFDANTGRTLAINDTFLAMTGHSRADFEEGRWDWRDFTVPEFLSLDEAAIAQARSKGFWDPYEKEYRRRDGSRFPVRLSSAQLPSEPGCVVASVEDISGSRAAEAELRESQQRLQLAQQAAGIGVWDWNLTTDAITWSPEMHRLLDIPPETPLDRLFEAWVQAVHPDDRERAAAVAHHGSQTGEAFSLDFRVLRRDGEVRWVRSQGMGILDEGRPVRLTGINVDVTAQHRVEDELRGKADELAAAVEESTRERNRVFDLSSELFAAAGFDGYLKTINPAWEALLGYSEAELLALPFITLIHPDDHAAAGEVVAAMLQGRSVQKFEDRLVGKDGKVVWVAWTAVPEGDRFYAVGRDVTRERERDEALRQSQKMEAMGQLTGGVAHDFNNLLTPIVGALDMLQRRGLGGEREKRLIDGAAQSAERAKTLVQRLLAFARRQPLQSVPVDMGKLVSGMADLVASTTGPQIRVVVDAGPDLPPAKADPNQLEMAILNLAVNARDAMPEGGTLRISVEAVTVGRKHPSKLKPGRYLNLSVADTGTGMDEATLTRAIEPFFSTKGIGQGTGLGLSMAHGLASQLGGALTIRSTPGMGTNVEFWLPQGEKIPALAEAAGEEQALGGANGTLLLVDDEDLVRLSTADMLIELGYDVIEASSAEEALRLLNRGLNPDIVVTDHLMPGMSGTELARQIQGERPSIKVLIVSGYAETVGIAPDLPRLTKPFRNAELASSLAALT